MSAQVQNENKPKKPKKSRAKDPAPSGVQFLTYSHPQDWSSKESRLAVRSHVTRRQHQLSRGEVPSPTEATAFPEKPDAEIKPTPPRPEVLRFPGSGHRKRKSVAQIEDIGGDEKRRSLQIDTNIFNPVDDQYVLASQSEGPSRVPSPWTASGEHSATSSRYASRSNSVVFPDHRTMGPISDPRYSSLFALPPNILSDAVAREMLFSSMEDFMLRSFAPMGFSALFLTPEAGRLWIDTLLHQSKKEPSLRLARLLFAAGHLCQINILRPEVESWLHEQTITEISNALQSEKRKLSEGLILATGRLAFYESMFGDRKLAHEFHRPAQLRMVTERGGMEALKLPEAMKYLMRWADVIMSIQSGTGPLLSGSPGEDMVQPDSAEHSLRALAVWLPEQYAALVGESRPQNPEHGTQLETIGHIDPRLA